WARWRISNLTAVNRFLQRRGPDSTQVVQHGRFTFVHNLLHMTGERIAQPFVDGDVVALYNGEIYNSQLVPAGYPGRHRYRSDGECLIPCYNKLGSSFPKVLDGEFALVLIDFSKSIIIMATDVFSTKPLWYSLHEGFHAASYQSALLGLGLPPGSVKMADPNQVLVLQLEGSSATPVARQTLHEFDLRQFKSSTADWQRAFRRAVWKRVAGSNHPAFVGLSSGYDSGALHLALELEAPAHSVGYFTIGAEESAFLVDERIKAFNKSVSRAWWVEMSLPEFQAEKEWLMENAEPFQYGKSNWAGEYVYEDGAAIGLSAIFRRCRRAGMLVYLSGAGADEIIRKLFPHSSFGGKFPDDLASLFPWQSVFLGTQRDYLMKEEVVAGGHGLEARYPFLDRSVVQEFLWLSAEAKNELYKRPVHDFLTQACYPFAEGKKEGFAASHNLKPSGPTQMSVSFDAMAEPWAAAPPAPTLVEAAGSAGSLDGACEGDAWRSARSRLVTFLLMPESKAAAVQGLAAALLDALQHGLRAAPGCDLGQLCMHLFSGAPLRDGRWAPLAALPWVAASRSGWPVFALLRRLAAQSTGGAPAAALPHAAELDVPLAALAASANAAAAAVLASARMCEAFAVLEVLSEEHYRVNLADAWQLLEFK
ncbi:unnamed protein product, partial [Prorocentrum cordatum]